MENGKTDRVPDGLQVLLPGVPGATSRGYLGFCTITLFAVDGGKEWGLFDTGHFSDRHLLLAALAKAGIEPDAIRHVVLSHLHFDHVLNLPLFPNAEVYLSQAELDYAAGVTDGPTVDHAVPDFWRYLLENRSIRRVSREFDLGAGLRLSVWPGHTPGGLVLFCAGGTAAVCGDVVKNAWEAVTGSAAMAVSAVDATASIRGLMARAPIIVPGHDRPFRHFKGEVEYLAPLRFEVTANLFPDSPNATLLELKRGQTRHSFHDSHITKNRKRGGRRRDQEKRNL